MRVSYFIVIGLIQYILMMLSRYLCKVTQQLTRTPVYCMAQDNPWVPSELDGSLHSVNPSTKYPGFFGVQKYDLGVYPDVADIGSVAPKTYQPKVLSITSQLLSDSYKLQVSPGQLLSQQSKNLDRFFLKVLKTTDKFADIEPQLLNQLAFSIFVKESKWTWVKEQKMRHEYSLRKFNYEQPQTFEQFLTMYNEMIEELVLISSLGLSPAVEQASSALEKHMIHEEDNTAEGIQGLEELEGDKNTWVNRLMHSVHGF